MSSTKAENYLLAAWLAALAATLGALFIGEVMGQAPCNLCWYQRISMFPLALILALAVYRGDTSVSRYTLPLAGIGTLIAGFHSLLYFKIIPESIKPCLAGGPSCSGDSMTLFGVIPLPLLSLAAFSFITLCLFTLWRKTP